MLVFHSNMYYIFRLMVGLNYDGEYCNSHSVAILRLLLLLHHLLHIQQQYCLYRIYAYLSLLYLLGLRSTHTRLHSNEKVFCMSMLQLSFLLNSNYEESLRRAGNKEFTKGHMSLSQNLKLRNGQRKSNYRNRDPKIDV